MASTPPALYYATMTSSVIRLSMWSGPRNISTAMMRSFGNRKDCQAIDEPFYAHYLTETGLNHPLREEVLASQSHTWQQVMESLNAPLTTGKNVLYVKHMTQHMLPTIDLSPLHHHQHCFLIRDPRLVIASFAEKYDEVTADATGFRQQLDLFHYFKSQNARVSVIEGEDIQKSPKVLLAKLCSNIGLNFDPDMVSWPAGRRAEDGVWGAHWYNAVEASTEFAPYAQKTVHLNDDLEKLAEELEPFYLEMKNYKLIAE